MDAENVRNEPRVRSAVEEASARRPWGASARKACCCMMMTTPESAIGKLNNGFVRLALRGVRFYAETLGLRVELDVVDG